MRPEVQDAIDAYYDCPAPDRFDPVKLMTAILRAAEPASRGRIEQDVENEQVRRLQREGRCPVCGVDQDGH